MGHFYGLYINLRSPKSHKAQNIGLFWDSYHVNGLTVFFGHIGPRTVQLVPIWNPGLFILSGFEFEFRSAIGAASNGSRVCDINSNDIAWLSQLVGMNLDTNQTASQLPVETTAERLSRLYHTSEQVITMSHTV